MNELEHRRWKKRQRNDGEGSQEEASLYEKVWRRHLPGGHLVFDHNDLLVVSLLNNFLQSQGPFFLAL